MAKRASKVGPPKPEVLVERKPLWCVVVRRPGYGVHGFVSGRVDVEADYHRISETGDLVFRNISKPGMYPEHVHTFSRGYWLEFRRA